MNIKTKDNEIYYLACIICEEVNKLEKYIIDNIALQKEFRYHPRYKFLLAVKNKLIDKMMFSEESEVPHQLELGTPNHQE